MPQKDTFHQTVINALQKQGWNVAFDPLFVPTEGGVNFFIDLGVTSVIGVEKNGRYVAVEIKSFNETSLLHSFYEILGQYLMYEMALEEQEQSWELYIAITTSGFQKLGNAPIFKRAIQKFRMNFIIFDPLSQTILQWNE